MKRTINNIIKYLIHFCIGIILYIGFLILFEGKTNFIDSNYLGDGKVTLEFIQWFWGLVLMIVSLLLIVPSFVYLLKLYFTDAIKNRLKYSLILAGVVLTPLALEIQKEIQIRLEVQKHKENNELATEYIKTKFHSYKQIYDIVNDSIEIWISDSLSVMSHEIKCYPNIMIDSLIIFNKEKNTFLATAYYSCLHKPNYYDTGHRKIFGFLIDNSWTLIPDSKAYGCLIGDIYNLKSSDYSFQKISKMNHIYITKGNLDLDQINLPYGFHSMIDQFKTKSIENQHIIIDSIFAIYKSWPLDLNFYKDYSELYKNDRDLKKKLKRAKRINQLIFNE